MITVFNSPLPKPKDHFSNPSRLLKLLLIPCVKNLTLYRVMIPSKCQLLHFLLTDRNYSCLSIHTHPSQQIPLFTSHNTPRPSFDINIDLHIPFFQKENNHLFNLPPSHTSTNQPHPNPISQPIQTPNLKSQISTPNAPPEPQPPLHPLHPHSPHSRPPPHNLHHCNSCSTVSLSK